MAEQNPNMQSPMNSQALIATMGNLQKSAQSFWKGQAHALEAMQNFAEDWFQRRHAGVQAAHGACERMCAAKSPLECFQAYQIWSIGAFQRLLADGMQLQQSLKLAASEFTPSLVPDIAKQDTAATPKKSRVTVDAGC